MNNRSQEVKETHPKNGKYVKISPFSPPFRSFMYDTVRAEKSACGLFQCFSVLCCYGVPGTEYRTL